MKRLSLGRFFKYFNHERVARHYAIFIVIAICFFCGRLAYAHGNVDQQQPNAVYSYGTDSGWGGQTFVPTANNMIGFDLSFTAGSTVTYQIRTYPGNQVLSTVGPVGAGAGVNHFDLPGKIDLTPGSKYAIVYVGSSPITMQGYPDVYAPGAVLSYGSEYTSYPHDLFFRTYYEPPPVTANNDAYFTRQNVALTVATPGVLANDTDPDGLTLTAIKLTNPANGTITLNANGSFVYTPALDFRGSDSFTYKATNGTIESEAATVSIAVLGAGDLDRTFGPGNNGMVMTQWGAGHSAANAVAVQSDGKIVAAGYASNSSNIDFAVARYNADGTIDTSFGTAGIVMTDFGNGDDITKAVAIQPDGKIVVVGYAFNGSNNDFALVRYNPDGSIDSSFGSGGRVRTDVRSTEDQAHAVVIQPDGKILAGGFSQSGGARTEDFTLVRYDATGSLDPGFGSGGKVVHNIAHYSMEDGINALALQPDGKIVAGGFSFMNVWGAEIGFGLVRYNTNGSLDSSFGSSGIALTWFSSSGVSNDEQITSLAIQSDGKIIAAGPLSNDNYGGRGSFALARYNPDGSLDGTFGSGGRVETRGLGYTDGCNAGSDKGYALALQPNGRIVVVGQSNSASSSHCGNVNFDFATVRYEPNGALDTRFGSGGKVLTQFTTAHDVANGVALDANRDIVAVGYATVGGTQQFALARFVNLPVGTIQVNPDPDSINAPWMLTGPNNFSQSGTGDQALNNLTPGDYTLAWGDVTGWSNPSPSQSSQALAAGETLIFNGIYNPIVETGEISGRVVSDVDGSPIAGLSVTANNFNSNEWAGNAQTQADGTYTITGLAPETYRVTVDARQPGVFWAVEYYNNTSNWGAANPVPVVAGQTTPNIDFGLSLGGKISGYVTDEAGSPIGNMAVSVSSSLGGSGTTTQANGYYETPGLLPGSYKIYVRPNSLPYIIEWYDNSPTSNTAASIPVLAGQIMENINLILSDGAGGISGRVTNTAGNPLPNMYVGAYDLSNNWIMNTNTGSDGTYTIFGLAPGQYKVQVSTFGTDYISEYYDNVLSSSQAIPVTVVVGQITQNIDFALAIGGKISGTVTRDGTTPAEAIAGLWATATYFNSNEWAGGAQTKADGTYTITGLLPGQYKVQVNTSGSGTDYVSEYYNNVLSFSQATAVNVTAEQTTQNIDFGLIVGGRISGRVISDVDGSAMPGLPVQANYFNASNDWAGSTYTQADGTYTITGLAPGTYRVQVDTRQPGVFFVQEFYNNTSNWGMAVPVTVVASQTTPNIDFGLSQGGKISGYVRDEAGNPISNMNMSLSSGSWGTGTTTQANGYYETSGLTPGSWKIYVRPGALPYVIEWYDNSPTSNGATSVPVLAGQITENINLILSGDAGAISGLVTNAASIPIPNINVEVFDTNNTWIMNSNTGSDGTYTIFGLAPGQYKVRVNTYGTDYASEYYNDILTFSQATPVTVAAGQTTPDINFALAIGGKITGKVTKEGTTDPIAGLTVNAYPIPGGFTVSAQTQADGTYTITGLSSGQYQVQVSTSYTDYISEYYNNVLSSNLATPVSVTAGLTTPNVDFALAIGGHISGKVIKEGTSDPIAGLWVNAYPVSSGVSGSTQTKADGTYTIRRLVPGQYRVQVNTGGSGTDYISEYYDNVLYSNQATPVPVTAGQTTPNIDFGLSQGGKISGYVRDEAGNPIGNMQVGITGPLGFSATTQSNGYYETAGLPAGSYTVSVQPPPDQYYLTEWYNNSPTSSGAASVPVVTGQTIQNINFSLTPVGRITGRVTRESGGGPLQGVGVVLTDFATGTGRTEVYTGADGTYSIKALPGSYRILASASAYRYEFYNNAATRGAATPVAVNVGQTTANIDFALALGGVDDGAVSFAGTLLDKSGTAIDQATVEVVGANPAITTPTDANGAYTMPGLPAGNPFVLKFSKAGYLPTYSVVLISTTDIQLSPYYLVAARGDVNALWTSDGAIWGRVDHRDDIGNQFVEGATVVATSTLFPGTTYPVYYCDDSGNNCRTDQGTYGNGYFLIPNAPEDTVIVQAFKDGWSFDPRTYRIFADGVCMTYVHGIPTPSNLTFAGYVIDSANAPLPGVTAQMVGNNTVTATTDGTGLFNVAGLPNNAGFYMNYSKAGYLPVYSSVISSTTPISLPSSWPYVLYPNGQLPTGAGKSTIMGRVLNPTNGATIGGAVVTLHSAKSPSGNAYVVNYCPDTGACSSAQSGTYGNGKFVIFNVDAGEAIVVRATKNGYDFSDRTIVTFPDAVMETSIYPSMAISSAYVENQRAGDGSYSTFLLINIDASFTGALPDGIGAITVTGPGGNVIATKTNFTYKSQNRLFWARLPGQPALGDYTFTVTGNGITVTTADIQANIRNLPVPDKNGFTYTLGYNPTFFWQALNYTECPLYYRLVINDMSGATVYSTNLVLGMLSHRVPAGILQRGQQYQFQIRAHDSSNYAQTMNSSRSDYVTITVPMLQMVSFSGTLKDKSGTAISGATVETGGINPKIKTTTDANGAFNLSGLPLGNAFVIVFGKAGYLPTFSAILNLGGDSGGHTFTLYPTRGDVNALWTSQGAIWGRVDNRDDNNQYVEGATVVASSALFPGTTYPVYYCDSNGSCRTDQGTYSNGRFMIANAPEQIVIVQAFKDGWSFDPRTFYISTDGVSTSRVHGIPTASNVTFEWYVKDNHDAPLPGVAVQMMGNNAVTTTTDGTGYFNLAGLPNNAGFYMKYTKAGYIPVYTPIISSTGPISNPSTSGARLYPNGQFPLVAGNSAITGIVVDRTTGAPMGGAVVTLDNPKENSDNSHNDNPYTVQYCNDSGACSSSPSGTYGNGVFVVFHVNAGDPIVVRAKKAGWDFSERTLVTFADAITEMTIYSAMAITPRVENQHTADGNYYTYLNIPIENSFTGTLPDDINAITVTGPDGAVIATKQDFTYSPQFRQFWARLLGQPASGDYTFTVSGNGMTATGVDVQTINRNLPVPDKNAFTYTLGADPTFSWPALNYTECPLYYRLVINDMSGSRVYASNIVLGMLSHTVPAGIMQMGQTYQFQVRTSDSSNYVLTQNSSWSGYVTFTVQEPGVITVNPEPAAMNTTAPWTLAGPNSFSQTGTGDQTINNLTPGDYTLTWGDVAGWSKPLPAVSTQTLPSGGTITFTGTYATETVTVPTVNGPTSGKPGQANSYTASGSTSSLGHTIEYQFDWKGDGTDLSAWGSATQSKTWTQSGNYNVKARARCITHPDIVSAWSTGLTVAINASEAIRSMPGYYGPGYPILVQIAMTPDAAVQVYAAEDTPPEGWTVTEINEGGTWDAVNKKVKWGPFFDHNLRTLTYKATPPDSETGKKTFAGSGSFDGVTIPVGGASEVDKGTFHPADTTLDYRIAISECTSYGFAWKTGATWSVEPNPIPIGHMTNACYLWKIGEVYHFDPNTTPPYVTGEGTSKASGQSANSSVKNADKSGDRRSSVSITTLSQSRRLLTGTLQGSKNTGQVSGRADNNTGWYGIKVEVAPVKGVQGYAVEETLPVGTEVQGINNSGNWDRTNGKVKWGPFLDNMPRTFQYQIRDAGISVSLSGSSPASSADSRTNAGRVSRSATLPSSLFSIKGVASFDGTDVVTAAIGAGDDKNTASLIPAIWMDFDGDGRSDLAEIGEGTLRIALMSGEQELEERQYPLPSSHKILGYGDWDGDGRADILLRDDSGSIRAWLMEGTKVREDRTISTLPPGAKPIGIGDVNGDGIADLLWRDAQGAIHAEVSEVAPESLNAADGADALSISRSSIILGWMDSRIEVISLGDYDGDGKTDILWRDGNGTILISLMEGTGLKTIQVPMIVPLQMISIGTGDMNGDGTADILWRDGANNLHAWLMNGANEPNLIPLGQPTPGWEVIGVGDYDGNGIAEILWTYRPTGERRITTIDTPTGRMN